MPDNPFDQILSELTISREDATLINVLTEMGTSGDKSQYTRPGAGVRFAYPQLENLHENPIINAYCSAMPDAAISKPLEFNFGNSDKDIDAEKSAEIVDWLAGFNVLEKTAKAQTFANVYGGAAIVYFVDDGQPQDQPLQLGKIKRFLGTRVFDRQRVIPYIESATTLEDIEYYHISTTGVSIEHPKNKNETYIKFHKSRIIPFYGLLLTDNAMLQRYEGWGKSTIEAIWESYRDYKTAILASSSNLNDSSLAVVSMDGFIELLRSNDVATIKKVFSSFKNMASNQGMVLMDKTKQSLSYVERQFTGVSQVVDKLREDFIGQTRIPHDKLFGESPSGLGATGEAEEKNWAKEVRQFQERRWRSLLKKQYEILLSIPEAPTKGKLPKQWSFNFPSIIELSEEQVLANRASQSTIDSTYQSLGVLTVDEIRQSRFAGAKFSYETTLDQEAYEAEKKKLEEQQAGFGGGFGDFGGYGGEALPEEASAEEAAVPEENVPVAQEDSLNKEKRLDAMRPSCMDCVTKHLGSALIKGREVENGYPHHIILVVGELSEAEQEIEEFSKEAADMIRDLRRACWAEKRSPMFEEVLAIYDVLGYDWEEEATPQAYADIEVPSYRISFDSTAVERGDGKKGFDKKGLRQVIKRTAGGHKQAYWVKKSELAQSQQGKNQWEDRQIESSIIKNASQDIKDKALRIRSDNGQITGAESISLAEFISDDFKVITESLYKPEVQSFRNRFINRKKASLAAKAMTKLPPATPDHISREMERDHKNNNLEKLAWETKLKVEKNPRLLRYVNLEESKINEYKSNIGKEITETAFMSTTTESRSTWFGDEALVAYEIEPKTDNSTKARYVDRYKNRLVETEVVYPPGSRFKVVDVIEDKPIYPEREGLKYTVKGEQLKKAAKEAFIDSRHKDDLDSLKKKLDGVDRIEKEISTTQDPRQIERLNKEMEELYWGAIDDSWNIQQRIKENGVNGWYDEANQEMFFVIGGKQYSSPILDEKTLKDFASLVDRSIYVDEEIPTNKKVYNYIIKLKEI